MKRIIWGSDEKFNGTLTVKAFHQDTSEKIELVNETSLGGSLNGANNHATISMKFTKKGMGIRCLYRSSCLGVLPLMLMSKKEPFLLGVTISFRENLDIVWTQISRFLNVQRIG